MQTPLVRFCLNNYKAIRNACIDIQGITLLTGPSGSGKSTLLNFVSKGFTCLFLYESMAQEEALNKLKEVFEDLFRIISSHTNLRIRKSMADPSRRKAYPKKYREKLLNDLQNLYDKEYPVIEQRVDGKRISSRKIYRNVEQDGEYALKSIRKIVCPDVPYETLEFPDLLRYVREYCEETVVTEEKRINERVSDYLPDVFWKLYRQEVEEQDFKIYQNDQLIASTGISAVGKIDVISKIYDMSRTDSRPVLDYQGASDYFTDNTWFKDKNRYTPDEATEEIRAYLHTILRGKVSIEEIYSDKSPNRKLPPVLAYKRDDGAVILPNKCETGLKTFLLFSRMLEGGLINE